MRSLVRAAFFVLALPAVARAAARLTWLERRRPLDELVASLRATPPFVLRPLAQPAWLLATLDRVLPLLPPWRYGRCLKRSLLLLDLWSRCGLLPRLHLGVPLERREGGHGARTAGRNEGSDEGRHEGRYEGHAWVTVEPPAPGGGAAGRRTAHAATPLPLATSSEGYPEAFVL